ncbi:autotransporter domain-containing protein [Paludibacterium sp. dN 18-1]|uniref:Autotransporter domain-containing protein n=1 Tax=Paludibacterium denitrificans TaxID=2675226 RepID=A0A844GBJ4_9NEIS|nr:autotransporter domain-containing protein [Paludibacterium denitrificans]
MAGHWKWPGSEPGGTGSGVTLNGGTLHTTDSFTTDKSITFLTGSTSQIIVDSAKNLTVGGEISGSGALIKSGGGTLEVSGAHNTFDGLTTINDGTVQIDNGASLGTGLIVLNGGTLETLSTLNTNQQVAVMGNSTVNVDAGTTATLGGTIANVGGSNGCFNKTGDGTLNMTGSATTANGTCVLEGTLRANGDLTSTVTVDAGAMLRGTGLINGGTTVSGTLAPGNSPGTLYSTGTVTMTSGSTYQEDIDGTGTGTGAGNYSRLLISGASSQFIANGTLMPILRGITFDPLIPGSSANNDFTPVLGNSFRIVSAQGGIVGRFSSLVQPSSGLSANTQLVAFYNEFGSNSIDLRLTPTSYARYFGGTNQNASQFGGALDSILAGQINGTDTQQQSDALYVLAGLNAEQLKAAGRGMAGEVHAAMAATAPAASRAVQDAVNSHLLQDQAGALGTDVAPARNIWFDTNVDHQQVDADSYSSGYKANRSQFTVGVDAYTTSQSRFGFGMSHAETDVAQEVGSGKLKENMLFFYGTHSLGRVYLDGMLSYGAADWTTSALRPIASDRRFVDQYQWIEQSG